MKINHFLKRKRILISDGHQARYVTAHQLSELACISLKHAYRIMKDPDSMSPTIRRLVTIQLLGTIPNWPCGWRFVDGKLYSPKGAGIVASDLENLQIKHMVLELLESDFERLKNENARLRKQLSQPRLVVNNPPEKQRRVLKVVK